MPSGVKFNKLSRRPEVYRFRSSRTMKQSHKLTKLSKHREPTGSRRSEPNSRTLLCVEQTHP